MDLGNFLQGPQIAQEADIFGGTRNHFRGRGHRRPSS